LVVVSYKGVSIEVFKGDITEVEGFDAIVNPANSHMIMGGGVARAIKVKGGSEIEEEAKQYAPVPVGEAIVTGAGKLKVKHVIHAPTMRCPAMRISIGNVVQAVDAALKTALKHGLRTIAFPGMGTGVGGVPYYESARVLFHKVKEYIDKGAKFEKIALIAWDDTAYEEFIKALKNVFKESKLNT